MVLNWCSKPGCPSLSLSQISVLKVENWVVVAVDADGRVPKRVLKSQGTEKSMKIKSSIHGP